MHQARDEPLQQLALAEDDHRLRAQAAGDVVAALDARTGAHPHEAEQQPDAAREQRSADGDGGGQGDGAQGH